MDEKCEICGATEKIQRHHISYEPEIIQLVCVECHRAIHNHGVGRAPDVLLNIGVGKDARVWWETKVPANYRIRVPIRVQQLGTFEKGEKIRVSIRRNHAK